MKINKTRYRNKINFYNKWWIKYKKRKALILDKSSDFTFFYTLFGLTWEVLQNFLEIDRPIKVFLKVPDSY